MLSPRSAEKRVDDDDDDDYDDDDDDDALILINPHHSSKLSRSLFASCEPEIQEVCLRIECRHKGFVYCVKVGVRSHA